MNKYDLNTGNLISDTNLSPEKIIIASIYDDDDTCYQIDAEGNCYIIDQNGNTTLIKDPQKITEIQSMFKPGKTDIITETKNYER